ncbi:YveK family protein [Glaciibacter psychrotolerans]|uniref:Uncharacterized protein involved in exopolysaccharide biosynthesis n=1 Tax=Glaciibacter psychrotolerans TaxID=670054 RepID=A0A7Z0J801_9MICO|nr:hypothetical protein [Leifsonia psychrotolerans]NYJ21409.1 uncharacterized protein involved in exopolysaccharide biosynthesis [Leifsonia psychrotolerans]
MKNTWSLEDLYTSIAREWRVLLIVILLFLGAAYGANVLWPKRYEAVALQTVEPIATTQASGVTGNVNMDTERVVATSGEVLALAAKQLPGVAVDELADSIEVTVPKGAQVLMFTYTATTPDRAAAGANAIAKAYSEQRVATAQSVVDAAAKNLSARIADLTTQMSAYQLNSPDYNTLSLQIQTLQERQATLTSTTFYSGSLVSPAVAPSGSTKPSLTVFMAAGLFLGVFVGAFIALIRARVRGIRAQRSEPEHKLALANRAQTHPGSPSTDVRIVPHPRGRTRN